MKSQNQTAAGDLLMLRLARPRWSAALEHQLRILAPRAILLMGPLPDFPEAVCELLAAMARCLPTPPILAIEEEGGDHDPLSAILPPLPSPQSIGQRGPRAAREVGELIGEALKLLGFNTNLAPVLDLAPAYREETSSRRAFSADPRVVVECGRFWVEGQQRHKIVSCVKQFPGLAGVPDLVDELPVCGSSMSELWAHDLIPYRELLPRLSMVMMSTAGYKAYDFKYPRSAVLSGRIVQGLLRGKLGYQGLVVAPGLETPWVRGALDLGTAAVESLDAGCDLLLVDDETSWHTMRQSLEQALESGKLPRERFDQASGRVEATRKRLAVPTGKLAKSAWNKLARRFEDFNQELKSG